MRRKKLAKPRERTPLAGALSIPEDFRWAIIQGDCYELMKQLPDGSIDHMIMDPPYRDVVHEKSKTTAMLPDVKDQPCGYGRRHDFGFEHITNAQRDLVAIQAARLVQRWCLVFMDVESQHDWETSLTGQGLEHVRVGAWIKLGGSPQFTGDRPGVGFEAIEIAHRPGKKRWNNGGQVGLWTCPVVQNRLGERGSRLHESQKPEKLMVELVEAFTEPGDIVLDPFNGSGTTGVACIRTGRRYIGFEQRDKDVKTSRDRLLAEEHGSTIQALRAGQGTLF